MDPIGKILPAVTFALLGTRWRWDRAFLEEFKAAIREGGPQVAMIASICACAQIIIAALSRTGLGVKLSTTIMEYSRGSLFLALVLTMVTCIILGGGIVLVALGILRSVNRRPWDALAVLGTIPALLDTRWLDRPRRDAPP
jgi:TRAP-type uncharacterized transport system fused permease subunit